MRPIILEQIALLETLVVPGAREDARKNKARARWLEAESSKSLNRALKTKVLERFQSQWKRSSEAGRQGA